MRQQIKMRSFALSTFFFELGCVLRHGVFHAVERSTRAQRIVALAFLFSRFRSLVETIKTSQLGGRFSPLVSSFARMSLAPKIVTLAMHITRYFWRRRSLYLEILGGNDISVKRTRVVLSVNIRYRHRGTDRSRLKLSVSWFKIDTYVL